MLYIEQYHRTIADSVNIDEFRLEVLNYMEMRGLEEEAACKLAVSKYTRRTIELKLSELDSTYDNKEVCLILTLRGAFPPKKNIRSKNVLHALFCDETQFITVKFEEEDMNRLLPYTVGTTLKLKGIFKLLEDGRKYVSKVHDLSYVSDTELEHVPQTVREVPFGYFDAYVRVKKVNESTTRRPSELLVEDEVSSYIIKTWNHQLLADLEINNCYYVKNIQKIRDDKSRIQFMFSPFTCYIALDKEISSHLSNVTITKLNDFIVVEGTVHNYELRLVERLSLEYNSYGETKTADKYIFSTDDEGDDAQIEFVDWRGMFRTILGQKNVNDYVKLTALTHTKYNKNYQLQTTEFTEILSS